MTTASLQTVFETYEVIKDTIRVTARSIHQETHALHSRTVFVAERKDDAVERLRDVSDEFDEVMVLSLVASFERELRDALKEAVGSNLHRPNSTIERLYGATVESIDRWTVPDMLDLFVDVVPGTLRGQIKQLYEYRNWVAHGKNPQKLPSAKADPKTAYRTLQSFVALVGSVV